MAVRRWWPSLCCALFVQAGTLLLADGAAARPGATQVAPKGSSVLIAKARATKARQSWRSYQKQAWRRGYVTLSNPGNGHRWTGYVIGPGNTLLPKAEREVRSVLASWRTGRSRAIDTELIRLIARVSDTFGGRPIRVVSGYRERSHAKDSHHKQGEALDFSIDGVPNWALRDYLRRLRFTGVGYYPNSSFVHVDVRGYPAYWVDLSGPGERPVYAADARRTKTRRAAARPAPDS
jgi:uncharacterized protein YcbK (DUF882 family)